MGIPSSPLIVVLVPFAAVDGRIVSPDYDHEWFREELARDWFAPLDLRFEWQPVLPATVDSVVAGLAAREVPLIALNLCDGSDHDGYPGLSVVTALERARVPFTGADSRFYHETTSKLSTKERLRAADVPTAPWATYAALRAAPAATLGALGAPLLVKPAISAASVGLGEASVVADADAAIARAERLVAGVHGRRFAADDIFVERFIAGREFTVLVAADPDAPAGVRRFPPVERVFHASLRPQQRFLTYERFHERFQDEAPLPAGAAIYEYGEVEAPLFARLQELAARAFIAMAGTGYARVDIRVDDDGHPWVLEVNSNCSLSAHPEAIAAYVLGRAGLPFHALVRLIVADAWRRAGR